MSVVPVLITRLCTALAILFASCAPASASEAVSTEATSSEAVSTEAASSEAFTTEAGPSEAASSDAFTTEAASSEQHTFQPGAAAATAAQAQGRLYRVKRGKQTSYLYGTVHVGEKSFFPLAPEVSRALAAANELVLELDTRAHDAFQQAVLAHGSYHSGDGIGRHVAPATLARLTTELHAAGIALSSVAHLKPWLLANILLGLELQRNGYDRTHGIESWLLANAATQGTTVTELESADYQLALFDTLSDEESERYLLHCLQELSDGSSLRKARAVMNAWRFGDPAALAAVIAEATADDNVVSRFTRATLLGKRNPEMAARIARIMDAGSTAFVGVGLLHLLGADGLPQLLAQRGYQIERMY